MQTPETVTSRPSAATGASKERRTTFASVGRISAAAGTEPSLSAKQGASFWAGSGTRSNATSIWRPLGARRAETGVTTGSAATSGIAHTSRRRTSYEAEFALNVQSEPRVPIVPFATPASGQLPMPRSCCDVPLPPQRP